jgi:predicted SprT family Zn-dependent metalloprotease
MNEHGLGGWALQFTNRKGVVGTCVYGTTTINLSVPYIRLNEWTALRQTVLHEIAHALVGPGHHHDNVWKLKMIQLGARVETCASAQHYVMPKGKYVVARCNHCGYEVRRDRRAPLTKPRKLRSGTVLPPRKVACSECCKRYNGGRYTEKFVYESLV